MNQLTTAELWIVIASFALVLVQGTWLFLDARKRGLGRYAWFWGIWGSTTMPLPLLLYWIFIIRKRR
ncbi:hypothetical protein JCM10914A_11880 [Paenibacillus sp. JCM 10914]|uniref:hypothetical protein n=1 Tax=Paenibacillus sp. JCM 10914 TaxID=1236974 RepID=UPI0003CCA4D8|nr:hypothetical protein [Paenibacillus sp. JCM 10914]GAE09967.1 hypothetical protein JCM10914_6361 [Paenibacillus sp. JCM 10914]